MTCEQFDAEQWRLSFFEREPEIVLSVLARLGQHYQQDVNQLPPNLRAYWKGHIASGDSTEADGVRESEEMLHEARAELRSERLQLVENWLRDFDLAESRDPWVVELSTAERDEFVSMLNDRRLLLSLEHGITESDMTMDPSLIASEARRQAVVEIDILAYFILVSLGPQIPRA